MIINNKEELDACIKKGDDISNADVSNVTNMVGWFYNSEFNSDISNWDVSNVTDMSGMFENSLFNNDISKWDISSLSSANMMFRNSIFNQDISKWNTKSLVNMEKMFQDSMFNVDINSWNISNVRNAILAFDGAAYSYGISGWNLNSDCDISYIFGKDSKQKLNAKNIIVYGNKLDYLATLSNKKLLTNYLEDSIIQYEDNEKLCILKSYVYKNKKFILKIPKNAIEILKTSVYSAKYINEDNNFYYFTKEIGSAPSDDETKTAIKNLATLFPNSCFAEEGYIYSISAFVKNDVAKLVNLNDLLTQYILIS